MPESGGTTQHGRPVPVLLPLGCGGPLQGAPQVVAEQKGEEIRGGANQKGMRTRQGLSTQTFI